MRYEVFLRTHTETVVLGLPASPARYLQSLCRGNGHRPFLLTPHRLLLPLLPFARIVPIPYGFSDGLLLELSALAARNEGKRLTLIPATEKATDFVKSNADALEATYIIRWTYTPSKETSNYESL